MHKRTKKFNEHDFELLMNLLKEYNQIWITSHCLAEASNLVLSNQSRENTEFARTFHKFALLSKESHISKNYVLDHDCFFRLGVADCGFIQKTKRVDLTITSDLSLFLKLEKLHPTKAMNFNRYRNL